MKNFGQRYNHKYIRNFIQKIFIKSKLSKIDSYIVASSLVYADLKGVWSHGIARTSVYYKRIEQKLAKARPKIKFKKIFPSVAHIDGDNGLGFIIANQAIKKCISLAKKNGVGVVGVHNSNHFGMAALYVEKATKNNCICWVFTNASKAIPPHGSMTPHFGTSPFAFGCPTNNPKKPFIIDMASSSVARGKLKFAAQRGEKIPFGLALDKFGKPTNDGFKAFEGIMLPFGGMKGAAISWMMDIVAGIFTGAAHSGKVKNPIKDFSGSSNVGHLMICIRTDVFQKGSFFKKKMKTGILKVKKLKLAKGFKEILYPGEPEYTNYVKNLKQGIQISEDVRVDLERLAKKLKIKSIF
ncbi:MAG: Ldh family oxidoreductase [Candidatus Fonsibacter sp.]|nr:Ldh family oxidoreductase [Candidatus Fonsibacter sp.]